jgi:hypothetical protein
MKRWGAVLLFLATFVVVAPEASAEPTTTPVLLNTVNVGGVGRVPISQTANAAEADAAYHQALLQAVSDGALKAQSLAGQTGAKLGAIAAISEDGGAVSCKSAEGRESGAYTGVEPDFGTGEPPLVAVGVQGGLQPLVVSAPAKPKPKKRKPRKAKERRALNTTARKADAVSCEVTSDVSLIYRLES